MTATYLEEGKGISRLRSTTPRLPAGRSKCRPLIWGKEDFERDFSPPKGGFEMTATHLEEGGFFPLEKILLPH